jgi:hypothetical protein
MASQRLSRLHTRILQWLAADHQRTKGVILSSYEELVKEQVPENLSRKGLVPIRG